MQEQFVKLRAYQLLASYFTPAQKISYRRHRLFIVRGRYPYASEGFKCELHKGSLYCLGYKLASSGAVLALRENTFTGQAVLGFFLDNSRECLCVEDQLLGQMLLLQTNEPMARSKACRDATPVIHPDPVVCNKILDSFLKEEFLRIEAKRKIQPPTQPPKRHLRLLRRD